MDHRLRRRIDRRGAGAGPGAGRLRAGRDASRRAQFVGGPLDWLTPFSCLVAAVAVPAMRCSARPGSCSRPKASSRARAQLGAASRDHGRTGDGRGEPGDARRRCAHHRTLGGQHVWNRLGEIRKGCAAATSGSSPRAADLARRRRRRCLAALFAYDHAFRDRLMPGLLSPSGPTSCRLR